MNPESLIAALGRRCLGGREALLLDLDGGLLGRCHGFLILTDVTFDR